MQDRTDTVSSVTVSVSLQRPECLSMTFWSVLKGAAEFNLQREVKQSLRGGTVEETRP